MKNNKKSVILCTDVHRKAGAIVIETLSRNGLYVIAGSSIAVNSGFFSRFCNERVIHPSTENDRERFQDWLIKYLRRRNIDMVIPISLSTFAISEIQDEVREYTNYLGPSHDIYMIGHRKITTLKAAIEAGVPIPKTWFPQDEGNSIDKVINEIDDYPVLLKPSISYAAKGITWCYNAEELAGYYEKTTKEWGECFVQDFVPPGKFQYKCDWLIDKDQKKIAGFVFGKARWYPPEGGSSTLNFAADRPDIMQHTYTLLKHIKWIGFCDMDWIDDPRDNKPKLMEINARFPDTIEMGISAGIDYPILMYKLAHNEKVEPVTDYNKSCFLRFLPADILWYLSVNKQKRRNTWPKWSKFFDKNTRYQLISFRDPMVFLGYLLENANQLFRKDFWQSRIRISKILGRKR